MCTTNRALVNSLECYMDELVDCFEDFVKKSIIIISVAVGVLVAVIAYVLKIIAERPPLSGSPISGSPTPVIQSQQSLPSVSNPNLNVKTKKGIFRKRDKMKNFMMFDYQDKDASTPNAKPVSAMSCYDEKVLKDIGFSMCSKTDCEGRLCNQNVSKSRPSIPSLPTGSPKGSAVLLSKEIPKKAKSTESCCSMCCNDKCEK